MSLRTIFQSHRTDHSVYWENTILHTDELNALDGCVCVCNLGSRWVDRTAVLRCHFGSAACGTQLSHTPLFNLHSSSGFPLSIDYIQPCTVIGARASGSFLGNHETSCCSLPKQGKCSTIAEHAERYDRAFRTGVSSLRFIPSCCFFLSCPFPRLDLGCAIHSVSS